MQTAEEVMAFPVWYEVGTDKEEEGCALQGKPGKAGRICVTFTFGILLIGIIERGVILQEEGSIDVQ